ncbi:hypothetical protein ACFOWB_10870 [Chenggangzhangella methanolivorans]
MRSSVQFAAAAALAVTAAGAQVAPALADDPTVYLEAATVGTAGETLRLTRVPVRKANGDIVYKDVDIRFRTTAAGGLSAKGVDIKVSDSPNLQSGGFAAGLYR